jgi:hypothetical protein
MRREAAIAEAHDNATVYAFAPIAGRLHFCLTLISHLRLTFYEWWLSFNR